jgi:sarcosine oxidase
LSHHDVIVIGLGGMGSAAAHHLARRGARVLGFDQHGPAHDRGSSHGGSRIIRQAYFEDPAYVPLLLRSYELWNQLERDSGADLVSLTGGLVLGRPESRAVRGTLRSAQQWGLSHEVLSAGDIKRRFPTFTPNQNEIAVYEPGAGFAHPEATVAAQLALAAHHGADLHFNYPVRGWEAFGGGVRVHTAEGAHTAERLIVCPGAWAPDLLSDLGVGFRVERQVQYWFQPRDIAPFHPDEHPVYIWEDPDGVQIYGFPAQDGPEGGAKVAFFRRGVQCTPDDIDRTVYEAEVNGISDHLRGTLPDLPHQFLRAATCMYTTTRDEHFILAHHPEHPQVTVACGFSGHGFKFVPVVGEVLADLAADGATEHPISLFDPRRLHPQAA